MKSVSRFIFIVLAFVGLAITAHAQSPREQLNQMVQQLQKTPNDNALREKIIKLATNIKPALAIPDEAVRYTGRAMFVFKTAKSEADYLDAAREYERAVASAPWWASYYADLCTIYEKAGQYAEAKRACDFALVGATDSAQAIELKQRIAGLEIGIERNSAGAQAQRKQEEFAAILKSIEGAVFQSSILNGSGVFSEIKIESGMLLSVSRTASEMLSSAPERIKPTGFVMTITTTSCGGPGTCLHTVTFSPDGKTVTRTQETGRVIVHRRVN